MYSNKAKEVMEDFKNNKPLEQYFELVRDLKYLNENPNEYYVDAHFKMYQMHKKASRSLQAHVYLLESYREICSLQNDKKRMSKEAINLFNKITEVYQNTQNGVEKP